MENNNSYSHILKYTSLFGGVQVLNILMGLLRNKLVAVILGPMGMGLVALFSSTIKLVVDSTNFGLHISAVRQMSSAFDRGDKTLLRHEIHVFRHWIILTALLGLVVCAALSPLLSRWTFSFGNHTLHFVFLSPVVALTTLTVGETAVLKATRRLKELAVSSLFGAAGVLIVSVPIYIIYNYKAIVPSLLLMALVQAFVVMRFSLRHYPLERRFCFSYLQEGYTFIKLGIAFVVAGMMGSGAELAIRAFLSRISNVDTVGLYNAVYVMIVTYAGLVFTAIDTDYYPRLSAIRRPGRPMNELVNSQIEVSLNIMSPLLALFILFMPILLPMLYSGKFAPALPMLQAAALSMYARAIFLPIEYISLSRGDSFMFLVIETFSDVLLVMLVTVGYLLYGLLGMGIAITLAYILELLFVFAMARLRYIYKPSAEVMRAMGVHFGLGLLVYFATYIESGLFYCCIGALLVALDSWYSMRVVNKNIPLVEKIRSKLHL